LSDTNRERSGGSASQRYRCPKALHVSPFMPMELDYRFVLTRPEEKLVAHMKTFSGDQYHFDATLTLDRQPWSAKRCGARCCVSR